MAELRFPSWLRLRLAQEGMLICFSTLLKGKVRDASASAQRGHNTAFLDDFFLRSFPYTQAEATPLWRTRGEISPLSKATARVCAEISTCFIRRVPDPRRVLKGALRAVTA